MTPAELIQLLANGGGHAILAVCVLVLWRKSELAERVMRANAKRLGQLEARLDDCMDDHLRDREVISQKDAKIGELQAAADERNRFNPNSSRRK